MANQTITVGDILYKSYRYAGILHGPMRGLSGSEQQEGVMLLNSMLDAYKTERAWIYVVNRFVFPINAGQQQYKIGLDTSGGIPDWQVERPSVVDRAGFIYSNLNPPVEVEFIILNEQQWAALSPKELTSTIPYMCYYYPTVANGTMELWPIPTVSWQIALYLWVTLSQVSGPDDVLTMPPAYDDALSYGLAVRLAALYPKLLNPLALGEIKQQAAAAKQRIRTINFPSLVAQCELASMGVRHRDNYGGHYNPLANNYT
jgi:hypothetical protein